MEARIKEMIEEPEEIVIGRHESGIMLEEGTNTSISRNYCANCKRKIHCYVKVDRDTKEAIVHKTCKNDDCECKCRSHYACRQCGYLHPYGNKCNRKEVEIIPDPKSEEIFNKIIEEYKKSEENKDEDSK